MTSEPFKVHVSDEDLADLQSRLEKTRLADDFANDDWSYGTNGDYLRELLDYWINDFDWRAQEDQINELPNFRTTIEGMPIHYLHQKGKGPHPIPLIMSHGWPWTFWDLKKVIGPLTDPAAYGGDPVDAFDVVVPSLPGFGFSVPLRTTGINYWRTADLWEKLMRDELGYDKFAAQGADWGALVTTQLGHKYADSLIGLHLHYVLPLKIVDIQWPGPDEYSKDEAHWYAENVRHDLEGSAYVAIQTTRPQTLTWAMNDSPIGLCAWMLEKRREWSDCGGEVERRFTKDELLTATMIYWIGQSFGTSARFYSEGQRNPWRPSHDLTPQVQVPTGIAVFPKDIYKMPRAYCEQMFNLKRWMVMPEGGHFGSMEEPELLVAEIRAFFRELR
ncbi:epoxide hydrolase family protein [Brooklawnia sp.]|uniref:epoxide hydrolase family protein n=1 Tax=Brooklawnia sp. TaxID=2699740 RepID=UPI00311F6A29